MAQAAVVTAAALVAVTVATAEATAADVVAIVVTAETVVHAGNPGHRLIDMEGPHSVGAFCFTGRCSVPVS